MMAVTQSESPLKAQGGELETMSDLHIPRGQTATLDTVEGELESRQQRNNRS